MKKKQWWSRLCLSMVSCLILLMSGMFGARAMAQAAPGDPVTSVEGLKVEILWNDSGLVRIGRDAPITVRVSSTSAEVSGTARVSVPIGNGVYYVLEEPLHVVAGEIKQAVLCVPVDYSTEMVEVEYRGDDGTLYASERLNFRPDYSSQEVYMAVISSDVNELAAFDRVLLNEYRGTTTRLFDFKIDTLPVDADVLKMYDIFLWDDVNPDQLSAQQMAALSSWVYEGGVLIVSSDSQWNETVEDSKILQENWGKGQYIYCGFTLQEVVLKYPEESGIRDFLYETVGEQRLTAIEESIGYGNNEYWSASSVTSAVDAERLPDVWQYALVLVVYLVVLGPVLYYVLKKKKRRNMLRGGMVVIALIFTGIIYLMGGQTRFYRPFMNYVSIREIRSGQLMETVYANVSSPNNSAYQLDVDGSYDVSPLISYDYNDTTSQGSSSCQMRIREEGDSTQVWIYDEIPFTSKLLHLTGNETSPYGTGFVGEITLFEEGFEGVLENQTGQGFECVCVLSGGRIVLVGDLEAGEKADLSQMKTRQIYGQNTNAILEEIAGAADGQRPGDSKQASKSAWRYQLLLYYFNNMMLDERNEALVLAFPVQESGNYLKDSDVDVQGITLMTEVISVDYEKNGQLYYPMGENQIEALQGNYEFTRNSTYENLCVLRYDFGDLRADRLLVQWPATSSSDSYMVAFRWGMEFYNWETNTYDVMESKEVYTLHELQPYLDENNCLTVRYAMNTTEEYYYEILLPEFSAVGRKMK